MDKRYQFTFEEQFLKDRIGAIPERTAFLDESGSFGFDFDKPNTPSFYVVCAILVKNSEIEAIESKVAEMRTKYSGGSELKSSSIGSNHSRRYEILSELVPMDFVCFILIVDKKKLLNDSPLTTYKKTFVKYLHQALYEALYQNYPSLTVVEDEYGSCEFQNGFKQYVYAHQPQYNLFNDYSFKFANSKNTNIVQIADLIAGSINKQLEGTSSINALKLFQYKIAGRRIDFPHTYEQFYRLKKEPSEFDRHVYLAAIKCAYNYNEKHRDIDEEDVRLRIIFLKHLLFRIQNIGDFYTYSQELVDNLNEVSTKKITRSYLYRKIIAPLRDEGVIIASSPHGYKIPTSMKDISSYINQTISVVGPMLSRIEKCRTMIDTATDGDCDILDSPALLGYKAYFNSFSTKIEGI